MGGPSGSSGTPSNSGGAAVAYQPTAQPSADQLYQSLFGSFAGSLSPGFASAFGNLFPGATSAGANPFSSTPGGQAFGYAQPFVGGAGSGTLTDPNNPFYAQAQGAAGTSAGAGADISSILAGLIPGALGQSGTLGQGVAGLSQGTAGNLGALYQSLAPSIAGLAGNTVSGLGEAATGAIGNYQGQLFNADNAANALNNIAGQFGLGGFLQNNMGPALAQALQAGGALTGTGDQINQLVGSNFAPATTAAQSLGGALTNAGQGTLGAGNSLLGYGSSLIGTGGNTANQGTYLQSLIPGYLQAAGPASQAVSASDLGYANNILQQGFDPQQALFNQQQNLVQQQAQAAAAAAGLGGSAYGASTVGNTLGNFDLNWQNNLLNRENVALGAALPAQAQGVNVLGAPYSTATNLGQGAAGIQSTGAGIEQAGAGLQSTGANLQGAAGQLFGTGLNLPASVGTAYGNLAGLGGQLQSAGLQLPTNIASQYGTLAQGIGNLGQEAINLQNLPTTSLESMLSGLNTGAAGATSAANAPASSLLSGLGSALQTGQSGLSSPFSLGGAITSPFSQTATLGGLPYNTLSTGTGNALSALGNFTNIGNQQYTIPQQLAQDLQSYLQLGQSASQLSGQLGALGQQELGQSLSGIGSALGTGSNLLFGNSLGNSGGLLGLTGLGSSGLSGLSATDLAGLGSAAVPGTALTDASVLAGGGLDVGSTAAGTLGDAAVGSGGGGFSLGSLLPFGAS